jgi:hypothetical protein
MSGCCACNGNVARLVAHGKELVLGRLRAHSSRVTLHAVTVACTCRTSRYRCGDPVIFQTHTHKMIHRKLKQFSTTVVLLSTGEAII